MPTIAIVGAGARLGLSLGRTFGRHGFDVALISRTRSNLDRFTAQLESDGITSAGFPADVMDRPGLVAALEAAAERFGGVDVLEYSPSPANVENGFTGALDVTVDNLRPQVESMCYGAVAATHTVLPAMLATGAGTLLYTTGGGSVTPNQMFGAPGASGAALRNWALNLNAALADRGVYAGHVAIAGWIAGTPGVTSTDTLHPDDLAQSYWDLHTTRTTPERLITP